MSNDRFKDVWGKEREAAKACERERKSGSGGVVGKKNKQQIHFNYAMQIRELNSKFSKWDL